MIDWAKVIQDNLDASAHYMAIARHIAATAAKPLTFARLEPYPLAEMREAERSAREAAYKAK